MMRNSICGAGLLAALAACAPQPPAGLTQEQQVMEAQRAARPSGKPGTAMRGDEGDVIYKNYLDDIGKPLPVQDDTQSSTTQ